MFTGLGQLQPGVGAQGVRGCDARPRRRTTRAFAAAVAAVAIACVWLGASTAAGAASVSVLDPGGAGVSAYGGWAAWKHEEGSATRLELRSPSGAVMAAPIPPSTASFEVQLGPVSGGVAAVYVRCSEPKKSLGCKIYELAPLGSSSASERLLAIPGGGSDIEPAIWKSRLAFVRPNAGSAKRPDEIYTWTSGGGAVRAVQLPESRGGREPEGGGTWPKGLTGAITGLTIGPSQLAYVTNNLTGSFGETTLWYEPIGGHPELIDQETSGAGNVCSPEFLSPLISAGWLYAYLHACDPSANPGLDRLTRYKHGEAQRAKYTFIHAGDDMLSSVVIDGAGVDWDNEGVKRLSSVSWRKIPLPVAQTFCTRSDPFC
ncbi:MAG TPA: hypothetical protein VKG82_03790 [Solirubrobacteraceae bacterium]|nr:hypothetical protein [Solirubrobacteraceae bacterium]